MATAVVGRGHPLHQLEDAAHARVPAHHLLEDRGAGGVREQRRLQGQLGVAQLQRHAEGELGPLDARAAQQRAVGGAEVGEVPATGPRLDAQVARGDERVGEHHVAVGRLPDREAGPRHHLPALAAALPDPDPGRGRRLDRGDGLAQLGVPGVGRLLAGWGRGAEEGPPGAQRHLGPVGERGLGDLGGAEPGAPAGPIDEVEAVLAPLHHGLDAGEGRVGERDVAVRGAADGGAVAEGDAEELLSVSEEGQFGHD